MNIKPNVQHRLSGVSFELLKAKTSLQPEAIQQSSLSFFHRFGFFVVHLFLSHLKLDEY